MKPPIRRRLHLVESSIAELRSALDAGIVTSVELVAAYLNRVAFYDRQGIRLNAIPVLNPNLFEDARAADIRRTRGESLGPLDGIPYTAKDSYSVKGLPVASGSPAFEHLLAGSDAFAIAQLRAAGAVLIGLTNMPPMAAGGMQRGLYGRAESPYNANFLPAAYASGSSNGAGVATAANFAAFGLGEETWSSGRAPASNNGLAAYTPSRGVISMRGNWPLIATMDVVVPYARSVSDLLEVLDALVNDDAESRGDFWREQNVVHIPKASEVRPASYATLRDGRALKRKRLGVPRMYINKDPDTNRPIITRPSVIELWEQAERDLEALGVEVIEVDFPAVSNYERDRPGAESMIDRGLVPKEFADAEMQALMMSGWDDFLKANGDPKIRSLADVNGSMIFPRTPGAIRDHYKGHSNPAEYPEAARTRGVPRISEIPYITEGLCGLEETRRLDFESWLDANRLDAVVFPASADVAPYDSDYNPISNDIAWRNGIWVANGNQVFRHLGIPTVTVTMGLMSDIGMPVGLTFAGRAYDDNALLRYAYAFDSTGSRRIAPPRTPALHADHFEQSSVNSSHSALKTSERVHSRSTESPRLTLEASISPIANDGSVTITVTGSAVSETALEKISVFINGESIPVIRSGETFAATMQIPSSVHYALHSRWRGPYGSIVTATAHDKTGSVTGRFTVIGGIA